MHFSYAYTTDSGTHSTSKYEAHTVTLPGLAKYSITPPLHDVCILRLKNPGANRKARWLEVKCAGVEVLQFEGAVWLYSMICSTVVFPLLREEMEALIYIKH
jgi:hypothetical protein